jgi:two-component system OmpR family response regulator
MRLLVVEDEPRMAVLLRRGFEEEGYAVDVADDGIDAEWLATENDYSAVVLDVMLPGRDGFDVCRNLRENGRDMPVIMLTARESVADRIRGLDAGADDYLVKPFSFGELCARVRSLVRRSHGATTPVMCVGDLRLDPARRQVWRGSTEIDLSPKEFAIFEMLMRHAGQVVTRTRLLENAWDFNADHSSNIVDQYLAYLRKKIDKPFGRNDIETIRGVGYRLRASAYPAETESSAIG